MYNFFAIVLVVILFLYSLLGISVANLQIFSIPILQFVALFISIIFFQKFRKEIRVVFSQKFWFFLLIFILYVSTIFINSISKGYPLIRIIQDAELFYDIIFIFGISEIFTWPSCFSSDTKNFGSNKHFKISKFTKTKIKILVKKK